MDSDHFDVQTFGSSLPVKVMEALTMAEGTRAQLVRSTFQHAMICFPNCVCVCVGPIADDQISVKVEKSGWAWMVCGERLIIWKICQTAVAKVRQRRMFRTTGWGFLLGAGPGMRESGLNVAVKVVTKWPTLT